MKFRCFAIILAFAFFAAQKVAAIPITFSFEGEVFGVPTGLFAGETRVSGFYTFDTRLLARTTSSEDPTEINIFNPLGPNELIDNWFISVTIGAITTDSSQNALLNSSLHHVLEFNDSPIRDVFAYDLHNPAAGDNRIRVLLQDEATDGIADLISPGSGSLTGTPIIRELDASLANCNPALPALKCLSFVRRFEHINGQDVLTGRADFTVLSMTRVAPEPTTAVLLALGLLGVGFASSKMEGSRQ